MTNCTYRRDYRGSDEQIDHVLEGICAVLSRRLHDAGEMKGGAFLETVLGQKHELIQRSKGEVGPLIAKVLLVEPTVSDTEIAKRLKCAASSVYGVRKKLKKAGKL